MRCAILGIVHVHTGGYFHSLKELGVEIVGFAEEDAEKAKEFENTFGLKYFNNLGELLDQNLDFVVICSHNVGHKYYTIESAKKGIHVAVEKPIATTINDAKEMISICNLNNVKLMICFPVRYMQPVVEAKALIEKGEIGDIISIIGCNRGSMPGGWFVEKEKSGGGAMIDHTVHVVDILNWIMDSPLKSVDAVFDTLIHDIKVDDCATLLMEFENGVIATLDTSWCKPKKYPTWGDVTIEFIGTKGVLKVDACAEHGIVYSDISDKPYYMGFGTNSDLDMLKDFIASIENNTPSPINGEAGLFAMQAALMGYKI